MIRPLELRDLARVMELEAESFSVEKGDAWTAADYAEWVAEGDRRGGLVYESTPGQVAGVVLFSAARLGRTMEIINLAVAKDWHRRGLGRLLLRAAIGQALIYEMTWIKLDVACDNRGAHRLYESEGFTIQERLIDNYAEGRDGWRMRLTLADYGLRPVE